MRGAMLLASTQRAQRLPPVLAVLGATGLHVLVLVVAALQTAQLRTPVAPAPVWGGRAAAGVPEPLGPVDATEIDVSVDRSTPEPLATAAAAAPQTGASTLRPNALATRSGEARDTPAFEPPGEAASSAASASPQQAAEPPALRPQVDLGLDGAITRQLLLRSSRERGVALGQDTLGPKDRAEESTRSQLEPGKLTPTAGIDVTPGGGPKTRVVLVSERVL